MEPRPRCVAHAPPKTLAHASVMPTVRTVSSRLPLVGIVAAAAFALQVSAAVATDVSATRSYLGAYETFVRTTVTNIPAGRRATAQLAAKVTQRCPAILNGAPPQSTTDSLRTELVGTLSASAFMMDARPARRFAHAVHRLAWRNRHLARAVFAYAAQVVAYTELRPQALCADLTAYRDSGFRELRRSSVEFVRHFLKIEAQPSEVPKQLLAPYERPDEHAELTTISKLEGIGAAAEIALFNSATALAIRLGFPTSSDQ